MKKEKRELTLGQLERKEKFEKKIPLIIMILSFCVFFAFIITIIIADIYFKNDANINKICSVYIYIELFLVALMIISYKVLEKIKNQIILKQKQMKLKVLKQLAKEHGGHIKAFVSLKNEKVITDILSKSIEKVVIDFTQDLKVGITTIYFSNDGFQSNVITSKESLISSLDEECKKKILNSCVESIELTEFGGNKKQIVISGPGFCYVDQKASEDELLEMFELKE